MLPFPKYLTFRNLLFATFLFLGLAVIFQAAWWVFVLIFLNWSVIAYFGTTQIRSNFHVEAFGFAENHPRKEIAITFDDGVLNPQQSNLVLDVLKAYKVPATFFCIGKNLESVAQIEVLKRMDKEGHLIGNHSYSHSNFFDFFSADKVREEIIQTDNLIQQHIGKKPLLFRPPYGITTPNIAKALKALDHKTIGWSLRSLDTVIKEENKLLERVKKKLKSGDVLLFHDHLDCQPAFLKIFLEYLLKEGYSVVGVDALLRIKPYIQFDNLMI